MAEALKTFLPMALSLMAGPGRISMVTKALLQNDGGNDVVLTPNSLAPLQFPSGRTCAAGALQCEVLGVEALR